MSLFRKLNVLAVVPGILLAAAVATVAAWLPGRLPPSLGAALGSVLFAVLLGLVVGNAVALPAVFKPGLKFSFRTLLRLAIVFLGARLSVEQVAQIGGKAVLMIAVLMTLALTLAHLLGRWTGISPKLASLIGIGTAVCGNSAIAASAPVIRASDDDVSFAVATNTLFGTVAVFLYPLLGHAFGMGDAFFGTWAGTAVNDTSQVVAAGFAYSDPAAQVAIAVKLTRNALMGLAVVAVGMIHARDGIHATGSWKDRLKNSFPLFVLGFLAMAALRSLGALDAVSGLLGVNVVELLSDASKVLILVSLAAVGLGTRLETMRRTGLKPFLVGLAVALITALTSLALIYWLGPAGAS